MPFDRSAAIAEALADVYAVFYEPGSLGDLTFPEAVDSLASEWLDREQPQSLTQLVNAEQAGDMRSAGLALNRFRTWLRNHEHLPPDPPLKLAAKAQVAYRELRRADRKHLVPAWYEAETEPRRVEDN